MKGREGRTDLWHVIDHLTMVYICSWAISIFKQKQYITATMVVVRHIAQRFMTEFETSFLKMSMFLVIMTASKNKKM